MSKQKSGELVASEAELIKKAKSLRKERLASTERGTNKTQWVIRIVSKSGYNDDWEFVW